MSDMNLVILKGRVAKPAEYHVLDSGKGVAEWRLAVALGPRCTEYHTVKVWSRADELAPRLVTGVTVLVRATAKVMEAYGVTYPAKDIKGWLLDADLTHISNEVCFDTNYQPQTDPESLRFSSKDSYVELLSRCEKVPSTFKLPPFGQSERSRCWLDVRQPLS